MKFYDLSALSLLFVVATAKGGGGGGGHSSGGGAHAGGGGAHAASGGAHAAGSSAHTEAGSAGEKGPSGPSEAGHEGSSVGASAGGTKAGSAGASAGGSRTAFGTGVRFGSAGVAGAAIGVGLSSEKYNRTDCSSVSLNPTSHFNSSCVNSTTQPCPPNQVHTLIYDDFDSMNATSPYSPMNVTVSMNAEKPIASTDRNTNWDFEVYDAYYNGTFNLNMKPDESIPSLVDCWPSNSYAIPAYFRIGPQSRDGLSRASYDSNPFYFAIGQSQDTAGCPQIYNNAYASLESSNDLLVYGRPWVAQATQDGDGEFQLTGSVTSPRASYNNYYNFLLNNTDIDYNTSGCAVYFSKKTITSVHQLTMNATVDKLEATVTWTFYDPDIGYTVNGYFAGTWWTKGAKLDFSAADIQTIGQSKRVSTKPKTALQRNVKWIVLGSIAAALIVLFVCICCCCSHVLALPRRWAASAMRLFQTRKTNSSGQTYMKASTADDSSRDQEALHPDSERQLLNDKSAQSYDDPADHSRVASPIPSHVSGSPTPAWSPLPVAHEPVKYA